MDQPRAPARRHGAVPELPDARRAAQSGRAAYFPRLQCDSDTAGLMGIRHPLQRLMPLLLMVASGFAGLGYQVVWTQQSALWLGHEAAGVLAVVTAFLAGWVSARCSRAGSSSAVARPARWYAACELIIALWSFVLVLRDVAGEHGIARSHGRAALAHLAMVGGVLRDVFLCCCPRLPQWARRSPRWSSVTARAEQQRPVDRRPLCQQHLGRRARRTRHRVLAHPRARSAEHRRASVIALNLICAFTRTRHPVGALQPQRRNPRRACYRHQPPPTRNTRRNRIPRHRLRNPRSPRTEPGGRGHRLHFRACCWPST